MPDRETRYRCDKCSAEWVGNATGLCPKCGVGIDIGNIVPSRPDRPSDSEMLDWLERRAETLEVFDPPNGDAWVWSLIYYDSEGDVKDDISSEMHGATIRECISRAMRGGDV